ncbi:hypothetical protein B5M42_022280 [Paenibacillus athensensis]|uniref:Uncharacterized protein n=1 Tax=Paenibacillus athensensis TaxID=1967502 RepID=A0A4Y8PRB4_9BACL|nr:hypothetical protein [Paenibacillus athensensis]MCD1261534.1 hypothetical protein [Paenibacillus athensensis]
MARYWLTPVTAKEPLTLGGERLVCEPQAELERLREQLAKLHPRLLPMFKASLLPGDEEAEACGDEAAEPDWGGGDDIRFDGVSLMLSHCAEAFIDRLLSPREALTLLDEAGAEGEEVFVSSARWLGVMRQWLAAGCEVILLREDGSF